MVPKQYDNLRPVIFGEDISTEMRRRGRVRDYKRLTGPDEVRDKKVREAEADGWEIDRRGVRWTRMAKEKPADERLENEVWGILARMGFAEMNEGRQFTIGPSDDVVLPRQIDVFAKDDETAVFVECTQRQRRGKKNMSNLIQKLQSIRELTHKSITSTYGKEYKPAVGFVIATRNVEWSKADLQKCKQAKITVITENELAYYAQLVKGIKHAARYQFLAHVFGGQKIRGLTRRVTATRGRMGKDACYTFLISPEELLKIAYVGHRASRESDHVQTYQRLLQPTRLKRIANYINAEGTFPTNIVINMRSNGKLKFDPMGGDGTMGALFLPSKYACAWIIDGQHRLYGYAFARSMKSSFQDDKTLVSVLAYENLAPEKEMDLFIDINSKQKPVGAGLLSELYAGLHWKSKDPDQAYVALLSRIALELNARGDSPIHDCMVLTGRAKTSKRCLTVASIRDGLKEAKLMDARGVPPVGAGPLSTGKLEKYDADLRKGIAVLIKCFGLFQKQISDHWEKGDGQGGYLRTNGGIRALLLVIKDISEHIRRSDDVLLCNRTAEETFGQLEPYLQVLVNYFGSATSKDLDGFRGHGSSSSAFRRQRDDMNVEIRKEMPEYDPPGLSEYLRKQKEENAENAEGDGKDTRWRWLY